MALHCGLIHSRHGLVPKSFNEVLVDQKYKLQSGDLQDGVVRQLGLVALQNLKTNHYFFQHIPLKNLSFDVIPASRRQRCSACPRSR